MKHYLIALFELPSTLLGLIAPIKMVYAPSSERSRQASERLRNDQRMLMYKAKRRNLL